MRYQAALRPDSFDSNPIFGAIRGMIEMKFKIVGVIGAELPATTQAVSANQRFSGLDGACGRGRPIAMRFVRW